MYGSIYYKQRESQLRSTSLLNHLMLAFEDEQVVDPSALPELNKKISGLKALHLVIAGVFNMGVTPLFRTDHHYG